MGAEATNRQAIREAMCRVWTTATGQHRAPVFLDLRRAPNTILNEMFSIDFLTANTGKNRDQPGETARLEDTVTISSWYRLNPKAQDAVRDLASDREETGRGLVLSTLTAPMNRVRTRYIRSTPTLHPLGEWYIRTSVYGVAYEAAIPAVTP